MIGTSSSMDADLKTLIVNVFGDGSKFEEWLSKEGLTTTEDLALMAATEKEVNDTIIPAAKTAGVPTEGLMDSIRGMSRKP